MTRIAITGIGVVAPGAIGIEAFRSMLAAGRTAISEADRFDTAGLRAHKAGLVRGFVPKEFVAPMKLRRMSALSRYAMAAARMAVDDRGSVPEPSSTGVAIGTAFGPVQTSVDYMKEYVEKGASLAPPQLFAESVANAPGSHVAIEYGFRSFNFTLTQRESSALAAAMYASVQIVKESAGAVLIGGIDEANEMLFSVLDRIGALAHAEAPNDEAARPFDARRNGMVLGEGSAVLIGEPGHRVGNAKRIYGYLSGFGIARDVTAAISDWGSDPAAVVKAMRAAIDDAGIEISAVDAVYASANSTRRGDAVEAAALRQLFGDRMPPVVATKGYFGEYAAGGALQLVAALLGVQDQVLPASCGFEVPDARTALDVTRERRAATVRNVVVNSLSAGGGIVSAVVSAEGA